MPRNGSGTYSLPQPPFVPQTTISSAAVNDDLSDMADALTASIARDGQTAMTGALKLANDGVTYSTDPNTGLVRTGADTQAIRVGGVDYIFETDDLTLPGDLSLSGDLNLNGGDILTPNGANYAFVIGVPYPWMGTSAPTGCILLYGQAISRTGNPKLFAICGTTYGPGDGSTTFNVPDMRGVAPAGKTDMGGTDRANLTGGNVLGAQLGAEKSTLITANLPPYTPAGTVASVVSGGISAGNGATTASPVNPGITVPLGYANIAVASSFTGTAQGGTSTPVSVVQPTTIYNWIARAA